MIFCSEGWHNLLITHSKESQDSLSEELYGIAIFNKDHTLGYHKNATASLERTIDFNVARMIHLKRLYIVWRTTHYKRVGQAFVFYHVR